jgi:hypothetical protein
MLLRKLKQKLKSLTKLLAITLTIQKNKQKNKQTPLLQTNPTIGLFYLAESNATELSFDGQNDTANSSIQDENYFTNTTAVNPLDRRLKPNSFLYKPNICIDLSKRRRFIQL